MTSRIGILGRGALGSALARSFRAAGYEVVAAGSSAPAESAAASAADVVILAIPLGRLRTVAPGSLAGRLVVDATNYWWERDGSRPDLEDPLTSSSETVQRWLGDARVVKAFGHVSVWELENLGRPLGHPERRAIAVAGDHHGDVGRVAALVDAVGFDPVELSSLAAGVALEPGTDAFGADVGAAELREILARYPRSQRGRVVARARGGEAALPPLLGPSRR